MLIVLYHVPLKQKENKGREGRHKNVKAREGDAEGMGPLIY